VVPVAELVDLDEVAGGVVLALGAGAGAEFGAGAGAELGDGAVDCWLDAGGVEGGAEGWFEDAPPCLLPHPPPGLPSEAADAGEVATSARPRASRTATRVAKDFLSTVERP